MKGAVPTKQEWENAGDHYAKHVNRFTSLHAADLIGCVYRKIQTAKTILDVGCGTGAFGCAYLEMFPNGIPGQTVIFSDLSQGMVDKCRDVLMAKIAHHPDFATKFEFQVEDATELAGISNDSIDVVVSVFAVFFIPHQVKTMATMQRVLNKETGIFAMTAWTRFQNSVGDDVQEQGFGAGFHDAMEFVFQDNHNNNSKESDDTASTENAEKTKELPKWKTWFDPANIKPVIVDQAGFESVEIYRSVHTVTWPSALGLWAMFAENPIGPAGKLSEEGRQQAMQRMIEQTRGSGQYNNAGDKSSGNTNQGTNQGPVLLWTASNIVVARGIPLSTNTEAEE